MRSARVLAALAAMLLCPALARADIVRGTRSDKVDEVAHAVELHLDRGAAKLVVRRTFFNGGPRHDQVVVQIDTPEGAVATGLRTLGRLKGIPTWFDGELLPADVAEARYRELTGVGAAVPMDPAWLMWRGPHRLGLQVFPVAPQDTKTVEYTWLFPTGFEGGGDSLVVPTLGTPARPATVTVYAARPGDSLRLEGAPIASGTPLPADAVGKVLRLVRGNPPKLGGPLATIPIGKDRHLSRFRVETAPRLSEAPRGARVVFLLDTSRSMSEGELAEARAAAAGVLAHLEAAEVEFVPFTREVKPVYGRLVPKDRALRDLPGLALARGNGSHLDDALAHADALLATAPPGAARRVFLLTDLLTRASLVPEKLRGKLARSGALLHIGRVDGARKAHVTRDDDSPWAPVARQTGGLVWGYGAVEEPDADRAAFEEWARPVRIDRLKIAAPGIASHTLSVPESLDEGAGFDDLRVTRTPVPSVTVSGELWATPIQATLAPSDAEAKRWAALVFGDSLRDELSDAEMMHLARLGGAVSPVTSYLAIEPGVRPSTEGLEEWASTQGSAFGAGRGATLRGLAGGARAPFDYEGHLRRALAAAWSACKPAGRSVTLSVETTLAEVVDVPDATLGGAGTPAENARLSRCATEAAWALALPAEFDLRHRAFTVTL